VDERQRIGRGRETLSMMRRRRALATVSLFALAGALSAAGLCAQTPTPGWTLVVRIVPNPLPLGRCAMISIEVQDEQGYRRNELSNGQALDFHKFRYAADTTSFQWMNGDPITGYICARPSVPAARTVVTVTMQDGLSGSVDLSNFLPGQTYAAVRYPPQAPLRIAGALRPSATRNAGAVATSAPADAVTPSSGAAAAAPTTGASSGTMATGATSSVRASAGVAGSGVAGRGVRTVATGRPVSDTSSGTSSGSSGAADPASTGQAAVTHACTPMPPPSPANCSVTATSTLVLTGSYAASGPRIVIVSTPLTMTSDGQHH
jgi:hypothetical protein